MGDKSYEANRLQEMRKAAKTTVVRIRSHHCTQTDEDQQWQLPNSKQQCQVLVESGDGTGFSTDHSCYLTRESTNTRGEHPLRLRPNIREYLIRDNTIQLSHQYQKFADGFVLPVVTSSDLQKADTIRMIQKDYGKDWAIPCQGLVNPTFSSKPPYRSQRVLISSVDINNTVQRCVLNPWGYRIIVDVTHKFQDLQLESLDSIDSGGQGAVYFEKIGSYQVVSKVMVFGSRLKKTVIDDTVRELAILKHLDSFGITPKLCLPSEEDNVCYNNCIKFSMERCKSLSESLQEFSSREQFMERFESDIKNCILTMHSLHIVHRDVKPENCLWSPSRKKFVLSDFGISHPVEESPGSKSWASSRGTPGYMTTELTDTKYTKIGLADLYINDFYAFLRTIQVVADLFQGTEKYPDPMVICKTNEEKLEMLMRKNSIEGSLRLIRNMLNTPEVLIKVLQNTHSHETLNAVVKALADSNIQVNASLMDSLRNLLDAKTAISNYFVRRDSEQQMSLQSLQLKLRYQGYDQTNEETVKAWEKYKQSITDERQRKQVQRLICIEREQFDSFDNPNDILDRNGARPPPMSKIRAYKSILRKERAHLDWVTAAKILIDCIYSENASGKSAISKNPLLKELRQLYEDTISGKCITELTVNEGYLECLLTLWEEDERSIQITQSFLEYLKENYEADRENIFVRIRALHQACGSMGMTKQARILLQREESLRKSNGMVCQKESVVMYYCLVLLSPNYRAKIHYEEECLQIVDKLKCTNKPIDEWSILDAFISYIAGQFCHELDAIEDAEKHLNMFVEYNNFKKVTTSMRLSQAQYRLICIYNQRGQFGKVKMLVNMVNSRHKVAGQYAHSSINGLCAVIETFALQGQLADATKYCIRAKQTIDKSSVNKSNEQKVLILKYRIYSITAEVHLDCWLPEQVRLVLEECDRLYQQKNGEIEIIPVHQLLWVRYLSRVGDYEKAYSRLVSLTQSRFEQPKKTLATLRLTELEYLLLNKDFNERYAALLTQCEMCLESMSKNVALGVLVALFRAEYHIAKGEYDLAGAVACVCELLGEALNHPHLGQAHLLMSKVCEARGDIQGYSQHLQEAQRIFSYQQSWASVARLLSI